MSYWFYTIKYVKGEANEVTHEMYYEYVHEILMKVHKNIEILHYAFEEDGNNRLHLHLLFRGPKQKLYLLKLRPTGWNIDAQQLHTAEDISRVTTYLQKDDFKEYAMKDI